MSELTQIRPLFGEVACYSRAAGASSQGGMDDVFDGIVVGSEHGHDHGEGHDHKEHADDVKTAPIPAGAKVMFTEPKDGAVVKSPVALKFGVEGMAVKPAGTQDAGTGHHHLIIGPAGIAPGKQVPKDETHIHYGKGQTEATVELPKGEHKLTMQFADGNHISFGKPLSTTITITVE